MSWLGCFGLCGNHVSTVKLKAALLEYNTKTNCRKNPVAAISSFFFWWDWELIFSLRNERAI
jgi:hypothetical protein